MSIPHSGNIRGTPLPDILEKLRQSKATGTLTIRKGGTVKSVYVKDGRIVFAASSDVRDRLGEVLVRYGKLTKENLQQGLHLYHKNAGLKKVGAILVENGFLAPKDLFNGLKIQIKDILYSLFLWDEGEYHFEVSLPADIIELQMDIRDMIAEIIQKIKQES